MNCPEVLACRYIGTCPGPTLTEDSKGYVYGTILRCDLYSGQVDIAETSNRC